MPLNTKAGQTEMINEVSVDFYEARMMCQNPTEALGKIGKSSVSKPLTPQLITRYFADLQRNH